MLITIVFPNTYSLSKFSFNQHNLNFLSQFIASLLVTFVHPNLYPNLFSLKVVVAPVDHPAQFVAVPGRESLPDETVDKDVVLLAASGEQLGKHVQGGKDLQGV